MGLGTGGKQEQLATMQMILQKQEQVIQQYGLANPLVNLKQYRDTLAKFINMAGFKDDTQFLMSVTDEQAQALAQQAAQAPKEEDSNTKAAAILAQVEREKAQLQSQTAMAKVEIEREQMQLKAQKDALELQQKQMQFEKEMVMKEMELAQKSQADSDKSRISESKELINALDKIKNISTVQ